MRNGVVPGGNFLLLFEGLSVQTDGDFASIVWTFYTRSLIEGWVYGLIYTAVHISIDYGTKIHIMYYC